MALLVADASHESHGRAEVAGEMTPRSGMSRSVFIVGRGGFYGRAVIRQKGFSNACAAAAPSVQLAAGQRLEIHVTARGLKEFPLAESAFPKSGKGEERGSGGVGRQYREFR